MIPSSGQNGLRRFVSFTTLRPARTSALSTSGGMTDAVFWRGGIPRGYNATVPASNRLIAAMSLFALTAQLAAAELPSDREVLTADLQRLDAMVKGTGRVDALSLRAVVIDSNARIDDKRSILYAIKTGTTSYQSIVATERTARVTGNVGVVRGVAAIRGVERKQPVDFTVRYMAVYVKRDGRWQMTASQATQLVPTSTVISGQPA